MGILYKSSPEGQYIDITLLDLRLHDVESVSDYSWIKNVGQTDLRKLPPEREAAKHLARVRVPNSK